MAPREKNLSIEKGRAYSKKLLRKLASDKEANFEHLFQSAREETAKNGLTEEILKAKNNKTP